MKRFVVKLFISGYQGLPEWMVRNFVFFTIWISLGLGFAVLATRPTFRWIRSALKNSKL